MSLTAKGWLNKKGTGERSCTCGTWKEHWLNYSKEAWPENCSIETCSNKPTQGAHVVNPNLFGERIVPMCNSCNGLSDSFHLKHNVSAPSANKAETCDKS